MATYSPPSSWDRNIAPEQDVDDDRSTITKQYPPLDPPPKRDYAAEVNAPVNVPHDDVDELPFTFGKYRGILPSKLIHKDPGYLVWVHENVDPNKWFFPEELYDEAKSKSKLTR